MVNSREATSELQDLATKGLFQQTGSRRWTTYRLSATAARTPEEEVMTPVTSRMTAEEREERTYELITEHGPISPKLISQRLAIPRPTVKYDLRKLVEAERIERTIGDPRDPRCQRHPPPNWARSVCMLEGRGEGSPLPQSTS
jgi:hypothetical protein